MTVHRDGLVGEKNLGYQATGSFRRPLAESDDRLSCAGSPHHQSPQPR
jgi:hypothetical protein